MMKNNQAKKNTEGEIKSRKLEKFGEQHTKAYDLLQKRQKELKKEVDTLLEEYFSNLQGNSQFEKFCQALSDETYWICNSYLKKNWSKNTIFKHYGYFIHALLKNEELTGMVIPNSDTFLELFQSSFNKTKTPHPFAEKLAEYWHFMEECYIPYLYDESVVPIIDGDQVYLQQNPIDYYHKKINDSRLNILLALLKLKKRTLMDKILSKINENKQEEPLEMDDEDYSMLLNNFAIKELLDAMQLSSFKFRFDLSDGILSSVTMEYYKLLFPLKHFIVKQKAGYTKILDCIPKEYNMDMLQNLLKESPLPHMYVLDKEIYESEMANQKSWGDFKYFCKAFSCEENESKVPELKPFIRIGNFLFCPSILLAQYDIVYNFIQLFDMNVTKQNKIQKERSQKLEYQLFLHLRQGIWETTPMYKNNAQGGDADIILQDEKNIVLIQNKKQKFPTDQKRIVEDSMLLDEHGAEQLNEFERAHPEICNGKNVTKWVVSSFDGCGNDIDRCRKVSYLDLLFWPSLGKYKNLSQFVKDVHADKPLQEIIEAVKKGKSVFLNKELGMALPLFNPKEYRKRIDCSKTDDITEKIDDWASKFENANSEERKTIIVEIRKLGECHRNNYMIWHYLGILLWQNGEYEEAEKALKRTLEILPDEPLTMRLLCKMYEQWSKDETSNKREIFNKMGKINLRFRELYWFIDENTFIPYKIFRSFKTY